jgi:hypothetical protein
MFTGLKAVWGSDQCIKLGIQNSKVKSEPLLILYKSLKVKEKEEKYY